MWAISTLNFDYDVLHCFGVGENVGFAIPNNVQITPPCHNPKPSFHQP